LLRPVPIVLAILRKCIGPKSSEREQRKSFLFLRPLADPVNFYQCTRLSQTVLYFMVFFVYSTIAPISNFFILICLVVQKSCILHQLVYIYPPFPDSGGKLWMEFFRFVPWGMMISQITIIGMLSLKRASGASIAMTPLFVCTVLFWHYIRQEHFKLAELLSAKECNMADLKRAQEGVDWECFRGKYVQPELCERDVFPETNDRDRLPAGESIDLFVSARATPQRSDYGTLPKCRVP
jgi:Calcium-dependent channel, 7TM region, putative phosphate